MRATLLNNFDSNIADICTKCGAKGTLTNGLQECHNIQHLWKEVLDKPSHITGTKWNPCTKPSILGIFSTEN